MEDIILSFLQNKMAFLCISKENECKNTNSMCFSIFYLFFFLIIIKSQYMKNTHRIGVFLREYDYENESYKPSALSSLVTKAIQPPISFRLMQA